MLASIQKAFDCVETHLLQPNQDLREYFEGCAPRQMMKEMAELIRCGIEYRRMQIDKSQEREKRRGRESGLTPKITEVKQNVAYPLKIYGKPRVRFNNQNECVVHCLDHSQSQQSLRNKTQLPTLRDNELTFGHSKPKIALGIKQVLSTRVEPTSQPSNRKVGRINTRKQGGEANRQMTEVINKQSQQILLLQKQNRRLKEQMQQMTHKEETGHLKSTKKGKAEKQDKYGCCCCSSDQEILVKLEKMYADMQKSHKRKGLKTYKITTNANYPMTSSQESFN